MQPTITEPAKRRQLLEEGYCIVEQVLDPEMLEKLRKVTNSILDSLPPEHLEAQRSTGSMVAVREHSFFAELIAYPPALAALSALGFPDPRFSSGYVISKPPHSPALFWHQDWWGWDDPSSYERVLHQAFLMYYLVDTCRENGCLRLVPRSHLKRHSLHQYVPEAHTDKMRRVTDPTHPAYQSVPDEVAVSVKAGDLVIGDSRLLHSAYPNQSDQRRTVITLWYHPMFTELSEGVQAFIASRHPPSSWPEETLKLILPLLPRYEGTAKPIRWNRIPGEALR